MSSSKSSISLALHFLVGWGLVAATLYLVCFRVPLQEETLRESYLIFFFHFPSAIGCLIFFLIAGGLSAWQLADRSRKADLLAASAVEIGLVACTICLATGMIWADAAWGKPWVWEDPRLLSVAVMWLCYAAYLVFRAAIESPDTRARFSAVMGVLFAINVPVVYFAIQIFSKVSHPNPMKVGLNGPGMRLAQWFGAGAFFVLYTAFWRARYRVTRMQDEIDRLEEEFAAARI